MYGNSKQKQGGANLENLTFGGPSFLYGEKR
jgi:hypothetical protein